MRQIVEGAKVEIYPNYEKKESECLKVGKFVQFGVNYEEFETGPGNYTTVIVLMDDGSMESWPVECVKVEVQED